MKRSVDKKAKDHYSIFLAEPRVNVTVQAIVREIVS